jgi:hypothetical protein
MKPSPGWTLFRRVSIPAICDDPRERRAALLDPERVADLPRVDPRGPLPPLEGLGIPLDRRLRDDPRRHHRRALGDVCSSVRRASGGMQIAAVGFLIIAQALQAFQTVVEEHLLHDVSASEVCAFEGFWGLYL